MSLRASLGLLFANIEAVDPATVAAPPNIVKVVGVPAVTGANTEKYNE